MPEPLVRYYVAASLDGFIADPEGGVGWLDGFDPQELGFDAFLATIGTVLMGRTTFDQAAGFELWPYAGKRTIALTSRPLAEPSHGAEVYSGAPGPLIAEAKRAGGGDIWLLGGGRTARGFLDAGLIDRLELYVIPIVLGAGIGLFGPSPVPVKASLAFSQGFDNGVVELVYDFKR